MVEKDIGAVLPRGTGRLKEIEGPHDVCLEEVARVDDRSVDVALRRQVDDGIRGVAVEDGSHRGAIPDIGAFECVAFRAEPLCDVGEAFQIAGVGQRIEIHNPPAEARRTKEVVYEI